MCVTTSGCATYSFVRCAAALGLVLLTTAQFSSGQELKAASTLDFSVRVLGQSGTPFQTLRPMDVAVEGMTRVISIPLNLESSQHGPRSIVQVVARFRGAMLAPASGLTARIDGGTPQNFVPGDMSSASVLTLANDRSVAGARSSRNRMLELDWKPPQTDSGLTILELEIRQY
jgi:hypothetical protein